MHAFFPMIHISYFNINMDTKRGNQSLLINNARVKFFIGIRLMLLIRLLEIKNAFK